LGIFSKTYKKEELHVARTTFKAVRNASENSAILKKLWNIYFNT
jgi:hypothetical protein